MTMECGRSECKYHSCHYGGEGPFCDEPECRWVHGRYTEEVEASVEKNMAALKPILEKPLAVAEVRLKEILLRNASRKSRLSSLYALIDAVGDVVAPHTACKRGCHHCCHMGVLVGPTEVQFIENYTRLKAAELLPSDDYGNVCLSMDAKQSRKWELRYVQVDCPFLAYGECSIYPVRPVNCRSYFNISDYPELCDLSLGEASVPNVNLSIIQSVSLGVQGVVGIADIRAYFPNVKEGKSTV